MVERFIVDKERLDTVNDPSLFSFHGSTRTACIGVLKEFNYQKIFHPEESFFNVNQMNSRVANGFLELESKIEILGSIKNPKLEVRFFFEHNFFGYFLNVEIGDQILDAYFRFSEEKYNLIKSGKVKIYLINEINHSKSILIEDFTITDQEKNIKNIRPVFYEDVELFFYTSFMHYKENNRSSETELLKIFPKKDQLKIPLILSWLKNLNRELMIYKQDIDNYAQQMKKGIGKKSLEKLKDLLNTEDELSQIEKNMITSWIEAIETYDKGEDLFIKKLFSQNWIDRFKFIELGKVNKFNLIPFFIHENSLFHKSSVATQNGSYVSYFDKFWEVKKMELIPTKGFNELSKFWDNWYPNGLLNNLDFLDGRGLPINYESLDAFLELFNQEGSVEDIKDMMFSISKEIEEDSEYCLHPDVVFDLQNNIFPYVTINRDNSSPLEYHCTFKNKENEFFKITFDLRHGAANLCSHRASDRGHNFGIYHLSLLCLMMIRDFLVPEYREQIFKEKSHREKYHQNSGKNSYDSKFKVKYVPRIKYKYIDSSKLKSDYQKEFPYRPKSQHAVRGHMRKLSDNQNASNESLLLARKYGYDLKIGTTFVQPHSRGGLTEDQKKIYRSKSLLKKIFVNRSSQDNKIPFWFKFEEDVKDFFEKKGYSLKVTSPTNDGGKDVEGLDQDGNIVLISCKCWAPNRKIERSHIDELAGTVERFKRTQSYDFSKSVIGIFATTSSYSPGAIKAAEECDIKLYAGKDLEKGIVL